MKTTEDGQNPGMNIFKILSAPGTGSKPGANLDVKDLELESQFDIEYEKHSGTQTGNFLKAKKRQIDHGETWAAPDIGYEIDACERPDSGSRIADSMTNGVKIVVRDDEAEEWRKYDKYDLCMKKFSEKVSDCLKFVQVLCQLLAKCLFPYDRKSDILLNSVEMMDEDSLPPEAAGMKAGQRKASPGWEDLCHLISASFTQFLDEGRKALLSKPIQKMELNSENLIAIFGHITDVISMSAIAFAKEVGWTNSDNIASDSSRAVLAETQYWTTNYWVCFVLCVLFAGLSIPAIRLAKAGHYGVRSDMRPVGSLSWSGMLSRAISLLAVSLYITIMKTQLDALSCIYDDVEDAWVLIRNSEIVCFSPPHAVYFTLSVVAICVYYPLATLLYPNIQYQNKGLDLKYDTTYVVVEAQGKLAIAGFAAFLPREKYLKMQLIVCICVNWTLGIIVAKMKPCLVKSYNLWKAGGFFVVGWCGFWALMNVIAGGQLFCLVLLVIGVGSLVIVLGYLQYKLYGWTFRKHKVKLPGDVEDSGDQKMSEAVRVQPSMEAQPGPSNPFRDLIASQPE